MGSIYIEDVNQKYRDWEGYHEGQNNWTIMGKVLDACGYFAPQKKQNTPWCAMNIDFMFLEASYPEDRPNTERKWDAMNYLYQKTPNYSAGAYEMAGYFKAAGKFYTDQSQMKRGDITFFNVDGRIGHVGWCESVKGSVATVWEGNAGDQLQKKWYDLPCSKIAGFGRPIYDGDINPARGEQKKEEEEKEKSNYFIVNTQYDPLTIRADAATSSKSLGSIPKGEKIYSTTFKNGSFVNGDNTWFQVTYNGVTGWVAGYYLERV